jgi:hypothetical protein
MRSPQECVELYVGLYTMLPHADAHSMLQLAATASPTPCVQRPHVSCACERNVGGWGEAVGRCQRRDGRGRLGARGLVQLAGGERTWPCWASGFPPAVPAYLVGTANAPPSERRRTRLLSIVCWNRSLEQLN